MNTLAAWARVPLPKPTDGADFRELSVWSPNMLRVCSSESGTDMVAPLTDQDTSQQRRFVAPMKQAPPRDLQYRRGAKTGRAKTGRACELFWGEF